MKVYEIEFEVDDYRSLLAEDDSVNDRRLLVFDGSSKLDEWGKRLDACLDNENAERPNIYSLGAINMLLSGKSLEILSPYVAQNSELLPVSWGGRQVLPLMW